MNIDIKLNKDFERTLDAFRDAYGEDFEILNGMHPTQTNFSDFFDGFVDKNTKLAEVSIDNNAGVFKKDIASLRHEKDKPLDKITAASHIFATIKKRYGLKAAKEWFETEYTGGFYLHDFPSTSYIPYCYAYDLTKLAREGLFFINDYNNEPPQHLTTFLDNLIEFISYMSNRSSGAVGIPNVLVWTFYFWKKDVEEGYYIKNPTYYIRQNFQKLIYRLNQPFMRIDQSAFVNVSIFDREYYQSLFGGLEFPDGTFAIDYVDDFIQHQKIFMEVVSEIRHKNMFTYPVLTYSLLKRNDITPEEAEEMIRTKNYDVFVDKEFARWCSDHNCLWNDSNFFSSSDVTTLSNCCRLLSDTSKLSGFINSIGGTALSIGSIKVNTINLVHIIYELGEELSEKKYLSALRKRATLCCKVLDSVRYIIKRNIEKGLLPNYCDGGIELDKQYCTMGILGMYETLDKFGYIDTDQFGNKSYSQEAVDFASKIFEVLNDVKDNFTGEYSFNIESVPAERAAVNLCAKDSILFGVNDYAIYSNQWIPLTAKCTINEKIRTSAILDPKCSGGAIAHINLENNFANKDMAWEMLNYIALKGCLYFAFNTRINTCKNRHAFVGTDVCPECGKIVETTWQRVVGFLTPYTAYSKEREKEFNARQWYDTGVIHGETSLIKD